MARLVLTPGPDHPITIEPNPNRVVVTCDGTVVADTRSALVLREAGYRPVQYIPPADVRLSRLERTDHETYCPFKGDASYFTVRGGHGAAENAAWSYEAPFAAVSEIKGYLAFYPDHVDIREEPA